LHDNYKSTGQIYWLKEISDETHVAEYSTDIRQVGTSAVKRFEGVGDRLSCTALRHHWCDIVLNANVST